MKRRRIIRLSLVLLGVISFALIYLLNRDGVTQMLWSDVELNTKTGELRSLDYFFNIHYSVSDSRPSELSKWIGDRSDRTVRWVPMGKSNPAFWFTHYYKLACNWQNNGFGPGEIDVTEVMARYSDCILDFLEEGGSFRHLGDVEVFAWKEFEHIVVTAPVSAKVGGKEFARAWVYGKKQVIMDWAE